MVKQPKPVPWSEWPDIFMPLDLVDLMPGFIGQKRAYAIAQEIGQKKGNAWVIRKEDFFDWLTGDKIYSNALRKELNETP